MKIGLKSFLFVDKLMIRGNFVHLPYLSFYFFLTSGDLGIEFDYLSVDCHLPLVNEEIYLLLLGFFAPSVDQVR